MLFRLGGTALGVIAVLSVLIVLTAGARSEGRRTWCRNNLRQLGILAYSGYAHNPEQMPAERGRAFWQEVRRFAYFDDRRDVWTRKGSLNPFACPVAGRQPPDLSRIPDDAYARLMNDPATIDYRGPASLPEDPKSVVLAADREGNHPAGGFVLLVDFSVRDTTKAVTVTGDWSKAQGTVE